MNDFLGQDPSVLVKMIYEEMWNERKFDLADQLISDDFRLNGSGLLIQSRNDYLNVARKWVQTYPGISYKIRDFIVQRGKVAVLWTGSDPTQGFNYNGITWLLVNSGKVQEAWEYSDLKS